MKTLLKKINLYFLFSVNDSFFSEVSTNILIDKKMKTFNGLAYAKIPALSKNDSFNKITYISDIYTILDSKQIDYKFLNHIEKNYNIVISDLIHIDRHLMNIKKEKRLLFAQEIIKAFLYDMENHQINYIVSEGIDDLISYFASIYCVKNNIIFRYAVYARMGNYMFWTDRVDTGPINFNKNFNKNKNISGLNLERTRIFIKKYINEKKQPFYVNDKNMLFKYFDFSDIVRTYKYAVRYFKDSKGLHYDRNPFLLPFYRMKKIYRKHKYKNYFQSKYIKLEQLKEKKYFIYPIHFHPEAATLIQGRWFNNQIEIIQMISKNLPVDITLIVKEHKVNVGRNSLKFYQEMNHLHNVSFVNENIDVYQLMQGSKGVITISSSMGLEALLLEKPVISFGDIFYNYSENVFTVDNYKYLNEIILKVLNHKFNILDKEILFFTLLKDIKEINNFNPHNYSEENISQFSNLILGDI